MKRIQIRNTAFYRKKESALSIKKLLLSLLDIAFRIRKSISEAKDLFLLKSAECVSVLLPSSGVIVILYTKCLGLMMDEIICSIKKSKCLQFILFAKDVISTRYIENHVVKNTLKL